MNIDGQVVFAGPLVGQAGQSVRITVVNVEGSRSIVGLTLRLFDFKSVQDEWGRKPEPPHAGLTVARLDWVIPGPGPRVVARGSLGDIDGVGQGRTIVVGRDFFHRGLVEEILFEGEEKGDKKFRCAFPRAPTQTGGYGTSQALILVRAVSEPSVEIWSDLANGSWMHCSTPIKDANGNQAPQSSRGPDQWYE